MKPTSVLHRRRRPHVMRAGVPEAGLLLAGRYRLEDVVGRGGMAEVWSAHDLHTGGRVAVKIAALSSLEVPQMRERFAHEVQVQGRLHHPHVVALLDAGEPTAELPWFVLELVEGAHLAAHLVRGPLPATAVAHLGAGVAAGLAHLHEHGLVHLDVKPANLLLSHDGAVKVADLGITRAVGERDDIAATGETVGTAAYLAPEQVTGAPLTGAADVYALGLVLLECLTGERSYRGTPRDVAYARLERAPLLPVSLGAGWTRLLGAMTALDPAARPDAAGVAARLAALVVSDTMPTTARDAVPDAAPDPTARIVVGAA